MDKQDFSDIMNNMKDLTLGQIFYLVTKLKYKTAVMIAMFVVVALGSAFVAGKYSQQKETAVMLESPFSMRIEIKDRSYDFNNLTLMRDPTMPRLDNNKVALSLREIQSAFDVMPVGQVIARVEENRLTGIWRLIISENYFKVSKANAKSNPIFIWNGHENDYNFKEQFINNNTIHRNYSDGCILAYEVDENRRSKPETFRWIKNIH